MSVKNQIIFGVFVCHSMVFAAQAPLQSLVQNIISDNATSNVMEHVAQEAQKMEEEIALSAKNLKDSVSSQTDKLREQAEKESEKIFKQYSQEAERLQKAVEEEVRVLRRNAAERIIDIATKAEEEALKAKAQARRAFLENQLASYPDGQSDSWKEQLKEEFTETITYLKGIVRSEEASAEREDYTLRFNTQSKWFQDTLEAVENKDDSRYYQLHRKNEVLANLVRAHRQAESLLEAQSSEADKKHVKKKRLNLLYAISDIIYRKGGKEDSTVASTELADEEIGEVVKGFLGSAKPTTPLTAVNTEKLNELTDKVVEDTSVMVAQKNGSSSEPVVGVHSEGIVTTDQNKQHLATQSATDALDVTTTPQAEPGQKPVSLEDQARALEISNRTELESELEKLLQQALLQKR